MYGHTKWEYFKLNKEDENIFMNQTTDSNTALFASLNVNIYKDKLKVGDVFGNYKALCAHLEENEKTGNSRNAQHKEWERYFDYERDGHKYIIVEIYDEPLPKEDERAKGNASEYIPYIEFILLNYLAQQEGKVASLTTKQMFYILGMCNEKYINKQFKVSESENISSFQIEHFNQRSFRKLSGILTRALNNLRNRRLIDYSSVKMIGIKPKDGKGMYEVRQATSEECDIIRKMEREALVDMGLRSIVLVYLQFKSDAFFSRVEEKLRSRYGIDFYYSQINLRFTKEQVIQAIDMDAKKLQLNGRIIDSLNQEARTKFQNNIRKIQEHQNAYILGKPKNYEGFELEEDYIPSQERLAEIYIRIK